MIRGLYDSAAGMIARSAAQDIIANNLANIGTNGFQREVAAARLRTVPGHGFGLRSTMSHEVIEPHAATDSRQGELISTSNKADIALDGPGYLMVQTRQGDRLVRAATVHADAQGNLVTASGNTVMGVGGTPVSVGKNAWQIGEDGSVTVGGQTAGKLRVVTADGPVERQGSLLIAAGSVQDVAGGKTRVLQGFIEKSNVQPVQEMVDMIAGMRAYEANQRSITAQDSTLQSLFDILRR